MTWLVYFKDSFLFLFVQRYTFISKLNSALVLVNTYRPDSPLEKICDLRISVTNWTQNVAVPKNVLISLLMAGEEVGWAPIRWEWDEQACENASLSVFLLSGVHRGHSVQGTRVQTKTRHGEGICSFWRFLFSILMPESQSSKIVL